MLDRISVPTILLITASALLSLAPRSARASPTTSTTTTTKLSKRADFNANYINPNDYGGWMLTNVTGTYPAGLGEPLNVIISAQSTPAVLLDSQDNGGFQNWALSLNFSGECLGQHSGGPQAANLGDGRGIQNQTAELRENFGDIYFGTCTETFNGGNHFRYFPQKPTNGALFTGAMFLAASIEKNLAASHDIVVNGYDLGRDVVVSRSVYGNSSITLPTLSITNQTTYSGSSSYANYTYHNSVQYVSGLLQNSSDGINHYLTVESNGRPAIDGLVAVITVTITSQPQSSTSGALPALSRSEGLVGLSLLTIMVSAVGLIAM